MKLKCLFASSKHDSNAFYLSGISVPDPYISIVAGKEKIAVVSCLEYSRVLKYSNYSRVYEIGALTNNISKKENISQLEFNNAFIIKHFFKKYKAQSVLIPRNFPSFLLVQLQDLGIPVCIEMTSIFKEREQKTESELKLIRKANQASAYGLSIAQSALRYSKIKSGYLYLDGSQLTSERLRNMIEIGLMEKGAFAEETIVAGGIQATDPHQIGYGPLRSNELIIVDIFPRLKLYGYHGDMTRTFLKGRANTFQKKLVQCVRMAQKFAISKVKVNVSGQSVHRSVHNYFKAAGYNTEERPESNSFVGFIHSTGHGLGLDVHEPPSIGISKNCLKLNHVITIEPGLYYPEIGGCRIEDVFLVEDHGVKKLSKFNYQWELP